MRRLARAAAALYLAAASELVRVDLARRARPGARRRLGQQPRVDAAGSELVEGAYIHLAYLWVGTPPQRVSAIVDTGSGKPAWPCEPCDGCGTHTDPPFDASASATAQAVSGSDWSQAYSEGSSWHAHRTRDVVRLGDADGRSVGFADPGRADARLANATHLSAANATASAPSVKKRDRETRARLDIAASTTPRFFSFPLPLSLLGRVPRAARARARALRRRSPSGASTGRRRRSSTSSRTASSGCTAATRRRP